MNKSNNKCWTCFKHSASLKQEPYGVFSIPFRDSLDNARMSIQRSWLDLSSLKVLYKSWTSLEELWSSLDELYGVDCVLNNCGRAVKSFEEL